MLPAIVPALRIWGDAASPAASESISSFSRIAGCSSMSTSLASAPMRNPPALFFDIVKARDRLQINQIIGLDDVILHQLQILAAAADHRGGFFLLVKFLQQTDRFFDAFHIDIFEALHDGSLLI
jgi:hypothetical protein